jgi:hypothetical protein
MYHFHALKPDVNCHGVSHISADPSLLDSMEHYFDNSQTITTNKTFKGEKQNSVIRYFYWWTISFSSTENPDGPWCLTHYTRSLVNKELQCTPFYSTFIKCDQFMHLLKVFTSKIIKIHPKEQILIKDTSWKIRIFYYLNNIYIYFLHCNTAQEIWYWIK